MKNKLDLEEQEILDAFEKGSLKPVKNLEKKLAEAKETARNTFNKNKRINLRLTERDFRLAHIKGLEEGIPYQTLLSSIIHKYLAGRIIEIKQ